MKSIKLALIGLLLPSLFATHAFAVGLFDFRVVHRKTTLCASLLTTVRARAPKDVSDLRKDLSRFFINELNGRPVLDSQLQSAVIADANSPEAIKTKLVKRIYGVERTFQTPSSESSVIGHAVIEGQAGIESFLKQINEQREFIRKQGTKLVFPQFNLRDIMKYQFQTIEYDYSPILAYLAAKTAFTQTLVGGLVFSHSDRIQDFLAFGSLVAFTSAMGAYDYPVRHLRSYEFGHKNLTAWITAFPSQNLTWAYWSKDIELSKEFLRDLVSNPQMDWPTLDQENRRETLPGVFRSLQQNRLPEELRGAAHFSIDALLLKDDAGTVKLLLVLRSRAISQPQKQTQEQKEEKRAPELRSLAIPVE